MVFAATARLRVGPLQVSASAYYNWNREQIVAFGDWDGRGRRSDELSDVRAESYRQASLSLDRALKREKPTDLPIVQPTRFEFASNLKAAKELGITFPPPFQLCADLVVE